MTFLYQISIALYWISIKIASFFNPKAKLWLDGRKNIFSALNSVHKEGSIYWFHCASLGELEQAKPVIEKIKEQEPLVKILITIFSPSGFEFAKKYDHADYVFYLPLDTPSNAQKFIAAINPTKAFFVKYEFWYHYLYELNSRNVSTYLISGVFRKKQLFFKWYGVTHKKMLSFFTHFFVQNDISKQLLNELNYFNVTITGDTRLDRVYENSISPQTPALIKEFIGSNKTIIVGSSWSIEENILADFIESTKKDFKYIIAPHDIKESRIKSIEEKFSETSYIKYSAADATNISAYKVLIIDNIGILANTYRYTDIAFIGGGFSGALHNILEPASFGNVVFFGPKHHKFHEAEEFINANGAFVIKDVDDFIAVTNLMLTEDKLSQTQNINKNYIIENKGASEKILSQIKLDE